MPPDTMEGAERASVQKEHRRRASGGSRCDREHGEAKLVCSALTGIQAVGEPSILLSHREQLLADMLDRLSFGHAAEFFSFLFVMGRSFLGGPRSKIHFPGPSLPLWERCVHAAYCRP